MKNKLRITVLLSVALIVCFAFTAIGTAADTTNGRSGKTEFSKSITAVTPAGGASVSLVNKYIETLFSGYNGEYSSISRLLFNNAEMASFANVLNDADAVRALYDKYDDYKPVNNTLKWSFNGAAENYTVTLSKEADLSTFIYKAATSETEVLLDNILYPGETYFWQVTANTAEGSVVSDIFSFTTENTIRTVDIDGVSNTRDIGGFTTPYGKTLNGLIYRSARIDDITEKGVSQMDALGIRSDIDLRMPGEGKENPSGRENNYKYLDCPSYLNMFEEGKAESVRNIFSLFANPENYPVIFHCSVGRDRTGSVSFILNNLLGVSREEIVCEYAASFFSVPGALAVTKESDELLQALNAMYIMLDGYAGETYSEKTENFLLSVGLSAEEITAIRDIMTGKTEVFSRGEENQTGYRGKAIVTFSAFGKEDTTFAVDIGSTVEAPYELGEGYVWTANGDAADFTKPVTANVSFVAIKAEGYTVTLISGGDVTEKFCFAGSAFDFGQFEKDGFTLTVIDETGEIITSLTVEKDTALNLIYIKK